MSWNLRSYYTYVTLPGVSDDTALDTLLGKFASSVLPELIDNTQAELWHAFDG